ncbi:MAG: peptidase M23 [Coxiella sp. RIFCSPHIGHO2_12_FULL_44_14]|nr:MAG: peptidase M23 [Coxiella sp. RIFCSPHIGHO2_12_FULL_44_14]
MVLALTTSIPAEAVTQRTELNRLNNEIAHVQATLSQEQSQRSQFLKELKKTEITLGNLSFQYKKINQHLNKQQILLQHLNHNAVLYQSQLAQQYQGFTESMRHVYWLSRQPFLKLILNPSRAEEVSRLLTYYHYFSQDQLSIIHQLQATLSAIENNQQQTHVETQTLKKLKNKAQTEQSQLVHIQQNRQHIIDKINTRIMTKNQKLAQLLLDKRLLERTLHRLEKENAIPLSIPSNQHFARLKGQLSWPTEGKILPYFGQRMYESELRWSGILIQAAENQPVHAIAAGKVVFAKWLPGYGLLLIISHGNGYMTLYGRNHNLYKKSGDVVQSGDLIASVGNSGGYDQAALYFAIRYNAKPLNPVDWCSKAKS